ncbi:aspartate/glutamate racemase family protein [Nocardioides ginsengisoli]|uniref:Aspartate/glutamate racemase family protein n=1 Tax=Nocardioides ginsengisoli TaxID=363868 RepID=A0ABW3W128_9ACTN
MHLRVILPIIGDTFIEQIRSEVSAWVSPGTEVDVVSLDHGPASIESEYDEALAGPGILQRVEEANADGVDAIFVSCGADPAIQAAREITDLPVVGGFEPAMLTALTLGERIGILQVLPNVLPMLRSLARRYAIGERLGTIRVIDLPVLGLSHGDDLVDRLVEQAASAVCAGEADVLVLGCTGMLGVAAAVQERLAADGLVVPVVDPTAAAVLWLESQVRMRLTASRTTYLTPPAKERIA